MAEECKISKAYKNGALNSCNVETLKKFLRSVGQQVSGNKPELIKRVEGSFKLGLKNVFEVEKSEYLRTLARTEERLRTPLGEMMRNPASIVDWSDDVSLMPDLTEKDIYNYFVFKLNTKRQLKSKVMYDDGHIHCVQVNKSDENDSHCFVRCRAIPSMPSANTKTCPDHHVWVMLSKITGCINSAHCSCTAGEGEGCNHIAALLYGIADLTERKKDGKLAPTSVKCKWSEPRKRRITPKKSQDIEFIKSVYGKSNVRRKLPLSSITSVKKIGTNMFKDKLQKLNCDAGWLKNFKLSHASIPSIHSVKFNWSDIVNLSSEMCTKFLNEYFHSLNVSKEDCVTIECMTRGQSLSDHWAVAREERITASNFGQVCKSQKSTKPDSTLKTIMGYHSFHSLHTLYGKRQENTAIDIYVKHMREKHCGLTVGKCGLLVTPEYPHLGASPDSLVNCTHSPDRNGLVEVKCPSSDKWRNKSPEQCALDPQFYCTIDNDYVCLKRSHNYYYQIQGQLGISGRKWCDFVVWTPCGISVERIFADEEFFQNHMIPRLNSFYIKAYLPELFTRRVKRGLPLYKS